MRRRIVVWTLLVLASCGEAGSDGIEPAPEARSTEAMSHDLGPFFQAETAMYDRMAAAVGTSAADNWVRRMIEHHAGAVAISRIVLEQEPIEPVASLARATIEKLVPDMDELRGRVREGPPDEDSALIYAPTIERMHQAIMSAEGADASQTWLRKMIEFHRGGVALSDVLLARDDIPAEIRGLAQRTRKEQLQQIAAFERELRAAAMLANSGSSSRRSK